MRGRIEKGLPCGSPWTLVTLGEILSSFRITNVIIEKSTARYARNITFVDDEPDAVKPEFKSSRKIFGIKRCYISVKCGFDRHLMMICGIKSIIQSDRYSMVGKV